MTNESITPEMIDCLRPGDSDGSIEAKLMRHALRQVDWQARRIAELEASLEHASRRLCHNIDCNCEPDRMMYRRALSTTVQQEHPDTDAIEPPLPIRTMRERPSPSPGLLGRGEHPDTVKLRAVMEWLDERERAFPEKIFPLLLGYEQGKINRILQRAGINRDRVSADISRLWCQQLREAIDAPPEVDRD